MRVKHYRMALLLALGVTPGIALAAPGLEKMADSLDELMKFVPMAMAPLVLWAALKFMFSESSGQSGMRDASAETSASIPSSVEHVHESASGPDQVAITRTERLESIQPDQPGRVGRKLHID